MVPKYVMRAIRRPAPGKAYEVLDGVLEFRRGLGIAGMTTMTLFSAESMIMSTTPFYHLADAEGLADGLLADPARKQAFADIDALCSSSFIPMSRSSRRDLDEKRRTGFNGTGSFPPMAPGHS